MSEQTGSATALKWMAGITLVVSVLSGFISLIATNLGFFVVAGIVWWTATMCIAMFVLARLLEVNAAILACMPPVPAVQPAEAAVETEEGTGQTGE
jgi:hypothetical protein